MEKKKEEKRNIFFGCLQGYFGIYFIYILNIITNFFSLILNYKFLFYIQSNFPYKCIVDVNYQVRHILNLV